MPYRLMVLADGETYTGLDGCAIVEAPDEIKSHDLDDFVQDALRLNTPSVVVRFTEPD